ncbi:hypothetical protein NPL06_000781, partial [Salmonella enterica]|nr:hypothetical protein [Salmonella enterica]
SETDNDAASFAWLVKYNLLSKDFFFLIICTKNITNGYIHTTQTAPATSGASVIASLNRNLIAGKIKNEAIVKRYMKTPIKYI